MNFPLYLLSQIQQNQILRFQLEGYSQLPICKYKLYGIQHLIGMLGHIVWQTLLPLPYTKSKRFHSILFLHHHYIQLLEQIDTSHNSDGFLFDNQILTQIAWHNYKIGEVSCPTSYHSDASSIGFWLCVPYGFGCLATAIKYRLARMGFLSSRLYPRESDA